MKQTIWLTTEDVTKILNEWAAKRTDATSANGRIEVRHGGAEIHPHTVEYVVTVDADEVK